MSPRSKKEYIEAVFLRYKKATRPQKKVILDEFCRTLGCHRKHAIRVLRGLKRFTGRALLMNSLVTLGAAHLTMDHLRWGRPSIFPLAIVIE